MDEAKPVFHPTIGREGARSDFVIWLVFYALLVCIRFPPTLTQPLKAAAMKKNVYRGGFGKFYFLFLLSSGFPTRHIFEHFGS